jgi:hypothetical protein
VIQLGRFDVDPEPRITWVETAMGIDGPEARLSLRVRDARGASFERLESGRLLRYRFGVEPGKLRAVLLPGPALPPEAASIARDPRARTVEPPAQAEAPPAPKLAILEMLGAAPASGTAGQDEPQALRLRLRAPGGRDLEASFPRAVLKRLVLGRATDPLQGRPLPGFTPPAQVLAGAEALALPLGAAQGAPPWSQAEPLAGEEDPATVARALALWWAGEAEPPAGGVFVGADPVRSPARWDAAPRAGKSAVLLLPDDAFPGVEATARRTALEEAWSPLATKPAAAQAGDAALVVLVSAEAPDVLASRLRTLARSDALRGKLLAVLPLAGNVRRDLPASLLAEGKLAGVGVAESSAVGKARAVEDVRSFSRALASSASGRRVEAVPGPFLWYF